MFCDKCGTQMENGAKFCFKCGAQCETVSNAANSIATPVVPVPVNVATPVAAVNKVETNNVVATPVQRESNPVNAPQAVNYVATPVPVVAKQHMTGGQRLFLLITLALQAFSLYLSFGEMLVFGKNFLKVGITVFDFFDAGKILSYFNEDFGILIYIVGIICALAMLCIAGECLSILSAICKNEYLTEYKCSVGSQVTLIVISLIIMFYVNSKVPFIELALSDSMWTIIALVFVLSIFTTICSVLRKKS